MRIAGRGVDFVPPAEADEAAAGDVFEVVEIKGEEEEGEYEDEDTGWVEELGWLWFGRERKRERRKDGQVPDEEDTEQVHQ